MNVGAGIALFVMVVALCWVCLHYWHKTAPNSRTYGFYSETPEGMAENEKLRQKMREDPRMAAELARLKLRDKIVMSERIIKEIAEYRKRQFELTDIGDRAIVDVSKTRDYYEEFIQALVKELEAL